LNSSLGQTNKLDLSNLYTPVKNFEGTELDTLLAIEYSAALKDFNEPIIYNNLKEINFTRITWFRDTIPVLYRLEKTNEAIILIKKKSFGSYFSNISDSIISDSIKLTIKEYKKIQQKLSNCKYWSMNLKTEMIPRNIIIETKIDNNYHFINKDEISINNDKNYKKLFNLIEYLDHLN
jgi:hypothetical protein